jgi:hypothetical protein
MFCNEHEFDADYAIGEFMYDEYDTNGSNQQLMVTRKIRSNYNDVIDTANGIKRSLLDYGLNVVRVKIEIPANCKGIGAMRKLIEQDRVNNDHGRIGYFEFHFKVDLSCTDDNEKLAVVSKKHRSAYSYNMLGSTSDKVLVAQRIYAEDYSDALNARQLYIDDLVDAGLVVYPNGKGVHYEYVVYDDNPGLDDNFVVSTTV